ncbi:MAG: T9SS type A sorting domain-containing protein, partial [Saprospiraceae bacterium]|nr:T9SS type A sorting domain-containing protein [Saprospiraceae bacterium]
NEKKFNSCYWSLGFLLLSVSLKAQAGTTITFQDQFGTETLNYLDVFNGKRRYRVVTGGSNLDVRWSGTRWEIDYTGVIYFSNTLTALNPPNLSIGNWTNPTQNGPPLLAFSGTGTTSMVLPIELLSFDAQTTEGGKTQLTWATASEKDNSHFDIERSIDGNSFHSIAQVKGNNKPSSYQYTDNQPFSTTYYRLKQVDYDGTATYSKVVSVSNKGGKALKVYPTLVSNGILTVDTEGVQLQSFSITNLLGQQVLTGKTTQQIDVSALAKGTYILKVGTAVAKFVKQ